MINIAEELGKQVPYSQSAEQALLGSILIDPGAFDRLENANLSSSDFYTEINSDIYIAMRELYKNYNNIDFVTLVEKLVTLRSDPKRKNTVFLNKEDIEGYIRVLVESVPSAKNIMDYVAIVKEKSKLRSLLDICGEISDLVLSDPEEANDVIELAEQKIYDLSQGIYSNNLVYLSDVLADVYKKLQELSRDPTAFKGMSTGFSGLDNIIDGIEPTDLVFIGARPGMGKTSFCLNLATNIAKGSKKNVAFFSLEMSKEQLVQRLLSSEAQVNSQKLKKGNLSTDDWNKIASSSSILGNLKVLIDDTPLMSCTSIKAKLRRVKDLGIVFIDYLGLMKSEKKTDSRVQEISDITRNLKLMAKELHVPVVVCSQLSRDAAKEKRKPQLSDLRDSGSIEQDADMVMFIHRAEYYDRKKGEPAPQTGDAEVIVAKNRHGAVGSAKMKFISQYTKFVTVDDSHVEEE